MRSVEKGEGRESSELATKVASCPCNPLHPGWVYAAPAFKNGGPSLQGSIMEWSCFILGQAQHQSLVQQGLEKDTATVGHKQGQYITPTSGIITLYTRHAHPLKYTPGRRHAKDGDARLCFGNRGTTRYSRVAVKMARHQQAVATQRAVVVACSVNHKTSIAQYNRHSG